MKIRVLFFRAFFFAPLIASGALAQTPAVAAPALPSATSAPAANDSPVASPATGAGAGPLAAPPSPFMRTQAGATTPSAGAGAMPSIPPAVSANPVETPGGPVGGPAPPKPKKIAKPPPLETALSADPEPTLQPNTFFATAKASERYAAIVDAGGWPTDIAALHPGAQGPQVAKLRKRLAIEGDLDPGHSKGQAWDAELTAAIKRFQARMGLRETGIAAGTTLKAMNIPAGVRFRELASSANRLAGVDFPLGDRYVVVNIPSTSVEAVESSRVVHHYVAIVGDPDHPSPEIAAHIQFINLNPTWTVPTSIIKKEIIPRMQRDPGYLTRQKIRILDGSGQESNPKTVDWNTEHAANYTLRQDFRSG